MNNLALKHFFKILKLVVVAIVLANPVQAKPANISKLKVPQGFKVELFADKLPNARTMVAGDKGVIFIGSRQAGNVYAISKNKKHKNKKYLIAKNLDMPNGIAFKNGSLYVAEISRILRFDRIEENLDNPPKPIVIRDDLPIEKHHGWRYLAFGPDGRLYIAIGAPCNICLKKDYAQIRSMKADGTDERVEAKGIRNSVGFTWHPQTKKLWFSDNGRDWMGDNLPPDEINRVDQRGQHFGFPYCHGGTVPDPKFTHYPCQSFSPPAKQLGAHVAPLGIAFYSGKMFPNQYRNQLLVVEHGSWNRSEKTGYRVAIAKLKGEQVVAYETFISGWLEDDFVWGRPAYVLVLKDGSLLISDDKAGAIYRVSYKQ